MHLIAVKKCTAGSPPLPIYDKGKMKEDVGVVAVCRLLIWTMMVLVCWSSGGSFESR
jgi:hypothetical protein